MERRGRSSRSDIRRGRAAVAILSSSCPCRLPVPGTEGWKQEDAASTKGAANGMGMEWNVKQSGQRGDVGLELELDSLAGRVRSAAHAFFRGGLFLLFQNFSTARSVESVEPWRPRLAVPSVDRSRCRCAALLLSSLLFSACFPATNNC